MIHVELVALPRGRFQSNFNGSVLVQSSTDIERASCRALLVRGFTGPMVTRWRGAKHDAMQFASIEVAAEFATVDEAKRGLRTTRWRPHPANGGEWLESTPQNGCVGAPSGFPELLATMPFPIAAASVAPLSANSATV